MKKTFHKVIIYHDEVKDIPNKNLKGHVLLFVPVFISIDSSTPLFDDYHTEYNPRDLLYKKICTIRNIYNFDNKVHYSDIGGKTWTKFAKATREILETAIDALKTKSTLIFNRPLYCKLAVIYYPKGNDLKFYSGTSKKEKSFRYDETFLRILIKGSAHFLYDSQNQIKIEKFITDGFSTYRPLNENRILYQILVDEFSGRSELRNYVHFGSNLLINHLPSDHRDYDINSSNYIDSNLLQVADLFLGSINRVCFSSKDTSSKVPQIGDHCYKKDVIAAPMRELLAKKLRGKGFINSSHYKTFVISQVHFSGNKIVFREVGLSKNIDGNNSNQLHFNFSN